MELMNSKLNAIHPEEDHFSSIQKLNNRIIIFFFSLIILLGLVIGASIIFLLLDESTDSRLINSNPAINAYCSVSNYPLGCSNSLISIIKPETDPNQLFSLSLDIALKALTSITHLISNSTQIEIDSEFKTCSSTLQEAVSQLNQTLRTLRVNPDVETLTDEQRSNMTKWIIYAEQELKYGCESTAVGEIRETVHEAMVHVSNSADFLFNYESVFNNFRLEITNSNWNLKTVVDVCMVV